MHSLGEGLTLNRVVLNRITPQRHIGISIGEGRREPTASVVSAHRGTHVERHRILCSHRYCSRCRGVYIGTARPRTRIVALNPILRRLWITANALITRVVCRRAHNRILAAPLIVETVCCHTLVGVCKRQLAYRGIRSCSCTDITIHKGVVTCNQIDRFIGKPQMPRPQNLTIDIVGSQTDISLLELSNVEHHIALAIQLAVVQNLHRNHRIHVACISRNLGKIALPPQEIDLCRGNDG